MKAILTITSIVLLNFQTINGQLCGTPHPTNPKIYTAYELNNLKKHEGNLLSLNLNPNSCVDVFFHIIRNTDGTNAFAIPNTDDIVRELNEVYSPHNIVINNAGIDFINNTNFVEISEGEQNVLFASENHVQGAINYYIVEELWDVYANGVRLGFIAGLANNIPSNSLALRSDRVLTSTSPHEVGHCLNLLHTHETSKGVEATDGSNCSSAGDLVCDTPADPRLRTNNVDVNCNYIGGGGYSPLTNNIMSYSREHCRNEFTDGQGLRMRLALQNETVLKNVVSNSCPTITTVNSLCYPQSKTIKLTNPQNLTVQWTTSSNVQIVSQNNRSVSVRPKYASSSGTGWVRARLSNGVVLEERFWTGKPSVSHFSTRTIGSCYEPITLVLLNTNMGITEWKTVHNGNSRYSNDAPELDPIDFGLEDGESTTVYVYAKNSCGWSSVKRIGIKKPTLCDCGYNSSSCGGSIGPPSPLQKKSETEMYPNPADTHFHLHFSDRLPKSIKMYNFYGREIRSMDTKTDRVTWDTSNLLEGTYLIKIQNGARISTHTVLIKH